MIEKKKTRGQNIFHLHARWFLAALQQKKKKKKEGTTPCGRNSA